MHAMSASTPTPARRPRLTLKRVLRALVLGLAAWWGVGWWLAVRPDCTLRFPGHRALRHADGAMIAQFRVFPGFDRHDVLAVLIPNYPASDSVTLDNYDLATGLLRDRTRFSRREFLASGTGSALERAPSCLVHHSGWLPAYLEEDAPRTFTVI